MEMDVADVSTDADGADAKWESLIAAEGKTEDVRGPTLGPKGPWDIGLLGLRPLQSSNWSTG